MEVGLVYDPVYLKHNTGQHPENAARLEAIMAHLEQTDLKKQLKSINPRPATIEELALVHWEEYIAHIQQISRRGGGHLDSDTIMSADSYEVALYAAGGTIAATDAVVNGDVSSAFAMIRPPGHHATAGQAMGFCLFNNVAVAARYALDKLGVEPILIIDFDVHHGNGTQEAFYAEPRVCYISTHQSLLYPGTGKIDETGAGDATGTKVNIPLPFGCGDSEYEQVFEQIIVPVSKQFEPKLIFVSAGYDPHWADRLAAMQVTVSGFARMVTLIKVLADEICRGRTVFALEGGYHTAALAASVKATFDVLLGNTNIDDPLGKPPHLLAVPDISSLLRTIQERHGLC